MLGSGEQIEDSARGASALVIWLAQQKRRSRSCLRAMATQSTTRLVLCFPRLSGACSNDRCCCYSGSAAHAGAAAVPSDTRHNSRSLRTIPVEVERQPVRQGMTVKHPTSRAQKSTPFGAPSLPPVRLSSLLHGVIVLQIACLKLARHYQSVSPSLLGRLPAL